jgi:hypothetical protein
MCAGVRAGRRTAVDRDQPDLGRLAEVGLDHGRPPLGVDPADELACGVDLAVLEARRAAATGRDRRSPTTSRPVVPGRAG